MQYRRFGNTELLVSEIGFGAWAIGGNAMVGTTPIGWGPADDNESKQAIHRSLDLGINFFDTADIYGLGHSEKLLGKILGKNKEIIIASKAGNVARGEQFTTDYSKQYIISACEASLKRLGREVIDYYQLHTARIAHLEQGECVAAMQKLVKQGKIRYWGLSLNTFDPGPEAEYLLTNNKGHGFQLVLNLVNQKALPVIRSAAAAGYGIIARMPLQFGLLTGKFDNESDFPVTDHRRNRLTKEVISIAGETLEPVWALCKKYNVSKTQLALSYVLSHPEVSTVIPGIRTPGQAVSNTTGMIKLDSEDLAVIEGLNLDGLMELIKKQG